MASTMGTSPPKHFCRLCYNETADTVDVFSKKGIETDYVGKITKYLYLRVSECDAIEAFLVLAHFHVPFLDRCCGRFSKDIMLDVHGAIGKIPQILRKGKINKTLCRKCIQR